MSHRLVVQHQQQQHSSASLLLLLLYITLLIPHASSVPITIITSSSIKPIELSSPSPSPSPSPILTTTYTPSIITPPQIHHPSSSRVRGVWSITRIVTLFGPTVAIYLYDRFHTLYDHYHPMLNAALLDLLQHIQTVVQQSPYSSKPTIWLSSMPSSSSSLHVTSVANEIIRLTNIRLRELAVVSRLQMDDDQYQVSKSLSASHVRITALRVMHYVLTKGVGKSLQPEEKIAVHALIASSVY